MTLLSVPLWFGLGDKMTGLRFVVLLMALVLQSLQHRDFPLCTAAHSLCHVHHLHTLWHLEGRREEGSVEDSRGQANRGKKRKEEERGQRHSGRGTRWTRLVSSIASYIMWMHPSIVLSIQTDTHTQSHSAFKGDSVINTSLNKRPDNCTFACKEHAVEQTTFRDSTY